MLGTQDLIIGLVLAAFFFGAKRLPEIARSLGKSMQEFKKGVAGEAAEEDAPSKLPSPERSGILGRDPPCDSFRSATRNRRGG